MIATQLRGGPGYWWQSFLMMTRWEIVGLRLLLPITVFVQVLTGAGFVLGVGLFFGQIPPRDLTAEQIVPVFGSPEAANCAQ